MILDINRLKKNIEKDLVYKRKRVMHQYAKKGRFINIHTYCELKSKRTCHICGKEGTQPLEIDHIVPLNKGGTNKRENLQAICHVCHLRKTVMEDDSEWEEVKENDR